jgi:prophage regulatory protein
MPLFNEKEIEVRNDILERLHVDPGRLTFGQLLQDREAAACEITRLRSEMSRMEIPRPKRSSGDSANEPNARSTRAQFPAGSLLRLAEVCKILSISRSTIYKRLSDETFPEPVRLGPRTVRWRTEAIEAWSRSATAWRSTPVQRR